MYLRNAFATLLLTGLSACSIPSLKWPGSSSTSQSDNPSVLDSFNDHSGVKEDSKRPLIVPLGDGKLVAASPKEIQVCETLLEIPEEEPNLAHASNYGERIKQDEWGRDLQAKPSVIVLHETVISEAATVDLFQTNHPEDHQQVSYHMLIPSDGRRVRIVPDENRAYGSGMSAFGDVTMRRRLGSVGSINNIALHLSLITPPDGRGDVHAHSGYTSAQYRTLAEQVLLWQARFGIPLSRLTTHAAVDRSRSRYDPRSFRWDRFDPYYRAAAEKCNFQRFNNEQAGP